MPGAATWGWRRAPPAGLALVAAPVVQAGVIMLRLAAGLEAGEMVRIAGEPRTRCGWPAVAARAGSPARL